MSDDDRLKRRARRLARLYPRRWRERFADEFEQLLVDQLRDGRHAPGWTADVVAHALVARLAALGLTGRELAPRDQATRALGILGLVVGAFAAIAIGLWSQVAVGWTWASPSAAGTRIALGLMSGALLGLSGALAVAALLVVGSIARRGRPSLGGLLVCVGSVVALGVGCAHVAASWPGAGASGFPAHSIVPAALARVGWAGTPWLSAYWLHPAVLIARPARLAWMVASPLLLTTATAGAVDVARRARPSVGVLRALAGLGAVGIGCAALFVAGAAVWILHSGAGPGRMFQPGSVDDLGLAALAAALLTAGHVAQRGFVIVRGPAGG